MPNIPNIGILPDDRYEHLELLAATILAGLAASAAAGTKVDEAVRLARAIIEEVRK